MRKCTETRHSKWRILHFKWKINKNFTREIESLMNTYLSKIQTMKSEIKGILTYQGTMAEERNSEYGRDRAARTEQVAPHGLSGIPTNWPTAFKPALSVIYSPQSIATSNLCQGGRL